MQTADSQINLLVTPKQAAKALAISPRTLWSLTKSGRIRHVRLGRSVRYDLADLRKAVDGMKRN